MPESQLLLVSVPGADWPVSLSCFLPCELPEALIERMQQDEHQSAFWLGYASPIDSLSRQLLRDPKLDPIDFLDAWRLAAQTFLQLRRSRPDSCRLINVMRLTPSIVDQLRSEAGISPQTQTNTLTQEISREDPCPLLDPRLLLAIDQRRVEADLYADLEACADLFGREPIFSLEIPSLRSPEFIQRCLDSWQAERQDRVLWRQDELALGERLHGLEQLLHQTQEELELSFLECQEGKRHAENTQLLLQAQHAELGRAIKVLQLLASMKGLSDETPPTSIQMLAILEGYRHSLKRAERLLASN